MLLLLLRIIPEAPTRLRDEYEEEIKYIILDEEVRQRGHARAIGDH